MKVYIACHSKELAQSVAKDICANHQIVSRWHEKAFHPTDFHSLDERYTIAIEDFNDIKRADALLLVAGPEKYSGGKFVEAGIAYGMNKPVYVLGRFENMLTYLFEAWPEALQ